MSSLLRQFEVRIPASDTVQLDSLRDVRKEFDGTIMATDGVKKMVYDVGQSWFLFSSIVSVRV